MKQLIVLALQVSIVATVLGFGLSTTVHDLLFLIRRPSLLLRSLVAVFVIMPVLAAAAALWFDFPSTTKIVLVALALAPVPPLLPNRQRQLVGHLSYGLSLMVVLSIVAVAAIPATAEVLDHFIGQTYTLTPRAIAAVLLKTTLLPLAAGVAIHRFSPAIAGRLEKPVTLVGKILLPVGVVFLLAGGFSEIWAAAGNGTVLAMVLFVVAGLAIGHVLGGPNPDESVVLALSTACRHPALALALATTAYPDQKFAATILLYLLVNVIVGIPYLNWQRRRAAPAS
jgi:BASS family bile acid:Na+ symporter